MPRIAKTVLIDHTTRRILIDGEDLPWFVSPNITIDASSEHGVAYVTLELIADHVEVRPRDYRAGDEDDDDDDEHEDTELDGLDDDVEVVDLRDVEQDEG